MNIPPEPSWIRKLMTRLANKIFKRKCRSCKYWLSFHYAATGTCNRTPFHPLCDEFSWEPACEYYDRKSEVPNVQS